MIGNVEIRDFQRFCLVLLNLQRMVPARHLYWNRRWADGFLVGEELDKSRDEYRRYKGDLGFYDDFVCSYPRLFARLNRETGEPLEDGAIWKNKEDCDAREISEVRAIAAMSLEGWEKLFNAVRG